MPEPTEQASKPLRTWRPMVAWTAGMLLVLGLMGLGAKAHAKYRETDRAVERALNLIQAEAFDQSPMSSHAGPPLKLDEVVKSLGTPAQAVTKLKWYLRLVWAQSDEFESAKRQAAVSLLGFCGPAAEAPLLVAASDPDPAVRFVAALALKRIRGEEPQK